MSSQIAALAANQTFMSNYDDWVTSPVTLRMLALLRSELGPTGLNPCTPEKALHYAGGVDKLELVLRLLMDFREYAAGLERLKAVQKELLPDYGAGKLLKSGDPV